MPLCHGARLNQEALHFKLNGKNIYELSSMDIGQLYSWLGELPKTLNERQKNVSSEILKELQTRLRFLLDVGLDYLSLHRSSMSLSGGESSVSVWLRKLDLNWSTCCIF